MKKILTKTTNLIKKIIRKLFSLLNKKDGISKGYIKNLLKTNNPVILEIGSAHGEDTLEFLQTFTDTGFLLYGFEPEPKNIALLEEKIKDTRFHLFKGVLSDTDGEITFNRSRTNNPDDLSLSGSIMNPKNHLKMWDWIHFDESIIVPSRKLDTFCSEKNIGTIDFVWCDVQGAEKKVLEGGREVFKNKVRYFYTEYSNDEQYEGQPTLQDILKLLPEFEIVKDFGTDILLKNKSL